MSFESDLDFSGPDASGPTLEPTPVSAMVEAVVGCKWAVGLLQLISDGTSRPSALQRGCPGLSAKVMNERLGKMTRFGILKRSVFGERPPLEVHYELTALGVRFTGLLDEVKRLQADLDDGQLGDSTN